ncbi:MAG: HU family DNA-binding protein [Thermomicrobium sp.]|nr:HU family DNA-binding protein [Thermomicrobium sp.]MCS7246112.1 HU family DNA-binding protein [Thermomicrobium sp.]MDW7981781.1 HU family DNA-binding protein [Thermomicrobium sp.]
MRKSDLIRAVAERTGLRQSQVAPVVNAVFQTIQDSLAKGEEVSIAGFGTFRVSERARRRGRNPRTSEPIEIPARRSPSFRPGTQLKRAVAGR